MHGDYYYKEQLTGAALLVLGSCWHSLLLLVVRKEATEQPKHEHPKCMVTGGEGDAPAARAVWQRAAMKAKAAWRK